MRDSEGKESRKRKIEKQSFGLHIKADYHYRAIPQCGKETRREGGWGWGLKAACITVSLSSFFFLFFFLKESFSSFLFNIFI